MVKRALKRLKLLHGMNREVQFRFREPMRMLGKHISQQPLMVKLASALGLNIDWLIDGELPHRLLK